MKLIKLLKICDKRTYVNIINNTKNYNITVERDSVGKLLDTGSKYFDYKVLEISTWADELWIDIKEVNNV